MGAFTGEDGLLEPSAEESFVVFFDFFGDFFFFEGREGDGELFEYGVGSIQGEEVFVCSIFFFVFFAEKWWWWRRRSGWRSCSSAEVAPQ